MAKRILDVMTRDVQTICSQATLRSAAEKLLGRDVGPLPVCEDGHVVGMLTDRDIVVRAISRGLDPSTTRVTEAMSDGASSCREDDDVGQVLNRMEREQVRRFIVVDPAGLLVGIVSLGDLAASPT